MVEAIKTMKGLVFGAGYMGKRISDRFGYKLSNLRINFDEDPEWDVKLEKLVKDHKPDLIINAIGKTGRPNIDWCEGHRQETLHGNVTVPLLLGEFTHRKGIYFVHIGSGCIYEGYNQGKGFSEKDEPNFYGPQFYAKTKIISENLLSILDNCLQLRIRMPIDNRPDERNLIDKLTKYPKVIDIPNSMTTVPHMLEALGILVEKKRTGIYNTVNSGTISAKEIMELYKEHVNPNHKFEVMELYELNSITKGTRSNCMLNNNKILDEGIEMPEIHYAVKGCLQEYKTHLLE